MRTPPADPEAFWRGVYQKALAEECAIDFSRFTHSDAWALGSSMVATAAERSLPITIGIAFGEQRVFHAALEGSSATNDDWIARKIRAVYKHNCSSWALECQQRAMGSDFSEYFAENGYRTSEIALAGGAVPLRVSKSLIGAVGASGLVAEDDHYFVIDAMKAYAGRRYELQTTDRVVTL